MREDWPAIDVDAQIDPPVDGLIDPVERMRAYRVVPEVDLIACFELAELAVRGGT